MRRRCYNRAATYKPSGLWLSRGDAWLKHLREDAPFHAMEYGCTTGRTGAHPLAAARARPRICIRLSICATRAQRRAESCERHCLATRCRFLGGRRVRSVQPGYCHAARALAGDGDGADLVPRARCRFGLHLGSVRCRDAGTCPHMAKLTDVAMPSLTFAEQQSQATVSRSAINRYGGRTGPGRQRGIRQRYLRPKRGRTGSFCASRGETTCGNVSCLQTRGL